MSVVVLGNGVLSTSALTVSARVMHLKMYSLKIKGGSFYHFLRCSCCFFSKAIIDLFWKSFDEIS